MARRSPQTIGKREREQAKLDKRERKEQKKAAAAAARLEQPTARDDEQQPHQPLPNESGVETH